jgi:RNA polymerase sigma-70 factor (ECF subfamily)
LEADGAAVHMGSPARVNGAAAVAGTFAGRAQAAQPALIEGSVGMAWAVGGQTKVAWDFSIVDGKIVHIDMLASPELLAELGLTLLEASVREPGIPESSEPWPERPVAEGDESGNER